MIAIASKTIPKLTTRRVEIRIWDNGSVEYAMETIRKGAWEYITKPIVDFSIIDHIVVQVLARAQVLKTNREELGQIQRHSAEIVQCAGTVAHDFKNIITGIGCNLSLAQMCLDDKDKTLTFIKRAEEAGQRATDLAQKLVKLSKPLCDTKVETIEVKPLVEECLELMLTGAQIAYEYMEDKSLPKVAIDSGAFCQVINNLVLNASQAMPDGGGITVHAIEMSLGAYNKWDLEAGNYVMIKIIDAGYGIPAHTLAKVFEPYFTTKKTGTGLGLASVKSILDKYKGSIKISSKEGEGTAVSLLIPVMQ